MIKAIVQPDGFKLDPQISTFINQKIVKLFKHYNKITEARFFLSYDNKKKENNRLVNVKISVPGKRFNSKRTSDKFEAAISLAVDSIKKQITKHKEKICAV